MKIQRTLFVVETQRANGNVLFDHAHVHAFDAEDEAENVPVEDRCCDQNTLDDDFNGPCPGGCEIRSPRIVTYTMEEKVS